LRSAESAVSAPRAAWLPSKEGLLFGEELRGGSCDFFLRDVADALREAPAVAERVADLAVALAPERVAERLADLSIPMKQIA